MKIKKKSTRKSKTAKPKQPSIFKKEDYSKDGVVEKKLVFKKTEYEDRGDHDKKYFVFTEPGKRKQIYIHADTKLIEYGPRFKGNGTFIIGYDECGTPYYIIKNNETWFRYKQSSVIYEKNGRLMRNYSSELRNLLK